jgi:hypothetical protein
MHGKPMPNLHMSTNEDESEPSFFILAFLSPLNTKRNTLYSVQSIVLTYVKRKEKKKNFFSVIQQTRTRFNGSILILCRCDSNPNLNMDPIKRGENKDKDQSLSTVQVSACADHLKMIWRDFE